MKMLQKRTISQNKSSSHSYVQSIHLYTFTNVRFSTSVQIQAKCKNFRISPQCTYHNCIISINLSRQSVLLEFSLL